MSNNTESLDPINQIYEKGYCTVPFELSAADRRAFMEAGNVIISLAQENAVIIDLLTCDPIAGQYKVRGASYSIFGARGSGDDKITMHVGYQSRASAASKLPERNQPRELRIFWPQVDEMLEATKHTVLQSYEELGEQRLIDLSYPEDIADRNIALRVARNIGGRKQPPGALVVSDHIDLGIGTLHLGESHGNWFRAVAVPPELVGVDNTEESRAAFAELRQRMKIIRFDHEREAAMFLDTTYTVLKPFFNGNTSRLLPVCYHAGIRPPENLEIIYDPKDKDTEDRLALLAFVGPAYSIMQSPLYESPTGLTTRPTYN